MRKLSLIPLIVLLTFAFACNNTENDEQKLKEELKTELKEDMQEDEKNSQKPHTGTEAFEWKGTYKFKNQTVTFNPDETITSTGDFPYNRYMVMEKNNCDTDLIGLVNMGIVEFHYKRKGNKIELYHFETADCKVKELFGVLEKQ
jgi:hypothetical protein